MLIRGDLPPGLQLAQVAHVCTEHALKYPVTAASTPIGIVLEVGDEVDLIDRARDGTADGVLFHEEDLGGEATAYAEVSDGSRFADLPLAGREPAMS